ncbi:MAG TPA: type IV pilus assembly protein PilM [Sedimentisphaerales bacterium]|nr:type IV pilus assembly protein PilM [Sedimentisphaerales bacterium]
MAAETGTVWAIDIGSNSLKALYLSETERGVVEVIGFDNIRHGKILSGDGVTDAEREELVALSLRKFVNKYDLSMDEIIISVPSQNSFARFVNLPPVEAKRIPEMVKFEAVQQIPFGINDVQWDWQLMTEEDSPEIKVGIFAIKNEVVDAALEYLNREDVQVGYVQMSPMALYNYLLHDRPDLVTSDNKAVVILNIGADNTDLVVCTKSTVWQRCILIGGNAFTRAISDAFRLNFEKAEKLKRTAPVSKYARQILQAMRPVFTDIGSEMQRSLGFYNNSNPNTKIVKIIALGGGTKLRGLLKYLQQTLQIPVERPDSFKRLAMGPGVSPAKFHENVCDFGIVYGLALQGLGLAKIESNLLPRNIARSMAWASKGKYFIAAACMLLAVSLLCFARTGLDGMNYNKNSQVRQRIGGILNTVEEAKEKLESEKRKGLESEAIIEKELEPFEYREMIPYLHEVIISALPNEKNNPKQARLYKAFADGNVKGILEIPRNAREQIFITNMSAFFSSDLATAQFGGADLWRRSRGTPGAEGDGYEMMEEYELEMMMEMERMGGQYGQFYPGGMFGLGGTTEEKMPGFVATIAGYSPYAKIGELMDPHGVENNKDKWGFVTRLLHLDEFVADGNSPFEMYKKTDPNQFKLEIGEVSWEVEMPAGIGIRDVRYKPTAAGSTQEEEAEWVLIDPMTKELISKIAEWDENGRPKLDRRGMPVHTVNDHWFVLSVKFVWVGAPESVKAKAPELPSYMRGRTTMGGTTAPQSSPSSGRSNLTTEIE